MSKKVWLDVETTGLDKNEDLLLEIALLVEERSGLHILIAPPRDLLEARLEQNPFVRDMHTKSGLLTQMYGDGLEQGQKHFAAGRFASSYEEAAGLISDFLKTHQVDGDPKSLVLWGNSVHFDIGFLEAKMPSVLKEVHYRRGDVSGLRVDLEAQTGQSYEYPKQKHHRAAAGRVGFHEVPAASRSDDGSRRRREQ
jgi:oligoribonuclease (3'-5' exoribonuclease)